MDKLLEKMLDGKVNDKEVVEVRYNNKQLWGQFCVIYSIDVESNNYTDTLDTLITDEDGDQFYKYLPSINNYWTESHKYYEGIEITLKGGGTTSSLSTKAYKVDRVKIYYPESTTRVLFRGTSDFYPEVIYPHRIKELFYINARNLTDMSWMFYKCQYLKKVDLSNFDISKVTNMSYMFNECSSLTSLNLYNFDTSNVTDMHGMFDGCKSLTSLDLSNWDTSNVTDMSWMFYKCSKLTSVDLSNFDTSNVTDMHGMFNECKSLTSLDLSNFDTSNVTDMSWMFYECKSLTSLDLSNFDTVNVSSELYMLSDVPSSAKVYVSTESGWTLTKADTDFRGSFIYK